MLQRGERVLVTAAFHAAKLGSGHPNFFVPLRQHTETFPNVPNSVLIFLKTDTSFHGVQPGTYAQGGRNMLVWVPEIGATRPEWRSLKLPIAIFSATVPQEQLSLTA